MTKEDYREYIREYLENVQYTVTDEDIDFYVWLWDSAL